MKYTSKTKRSMINSIITKTCRFFSFLNTLNSLTIFFLSSMTEKCCKREKKFTYILFSSAEHFTLDPASRAKRRPPPRGEAHRKHPQHPLVLTPRALLHTFSFFFMFRILRCYCILFRFFFCFIC